MERLVKELISYRSVDGQVFKTPEACQAHEGSLPRHVYYALTYPSRMATSPSGAFVYGFTTVTKRVETEAPAFLRAGGDHTVEDHADTMLGVALGTYEAVLRLAVTHDGFWRKHPKAFIRPIVFDDLRDAD